MASRVLPAMTTAEVGTVIDEHYAAESQALTGAAEANLLKLAELRGTLSEDQQQRWNNILAVLVDSNGLAAMSEVRPLGLWPLSKA